MVFILTMSLNAQTCPNDALAPVPGWPTPLSTPTTSANAVDIYLNQFGIAAIAADSGQYSPTGGLNGGPSGARLFIESDFSPSGNEEIITFANDYYVDASGATVLCLAPNSPKITASVTTFFCSDLGLNQITLTYTDASNNTTNENIWINVIDPSSPTVVAQNATFALDQSGSLVVSDADAIAFNLATTSSFNNLTGYCPTSYVYSISPNTFDCDDLGSNTVTLTVTNPSNNASSTTTTDIIVVDTLDPVITVTSLNPTVTLNAAGNGILFFSEVATSSDNCDGTPTETVTPNTFDCSDAGTTVLVTLTSEDASGNIATTTVSVAVEDVIDPDFLATGSPEIGSNGEVLLSDPTWYTVFDACNTTIVFSPTTLDCSASNALVSYVITDDSGNQTTGTISVTPVDLIDPVIITQDITVSLDANGSYTLTAADIDNGSSDNCGLDVSSVSPSVFDCDDVGSNNVTLTWTDDSGNSATGTAVVTVEDNLAPNTVALSGQYVLFSNQLLSGEIAVTSTVLNPTSSDNCLIVDTVLTDLDSSLFFKPGQLINTFTCDDVSFTDVDGVYHDNARDIIIYNIDAAGNWSRDTANVILVDVDAPVISVTNANVSLDVNGQVSLLSDDYVTAVDECGLDSLWMSQTDFDCDDIGVQTIQAFARDIHNNSSSLTLTVTVNDNTAPAITVLQPTIDLYLNASGSATLSSDVSTMATALDNCTDNPSVLLDITTFDCDDAGNNLVTVTSTDDASNVSTATFTVNVIDSVSPVVVADATVDVYIGNGSAILQYGDINDLSTDNCAIATYQLSKTNFLCEDLGLNPITYTVTDAAGNSTTVDIDVTVIDNTSPFAIAQGFTVQLDVFGGAVITPSMVDNGSTDNCSIVSYTLSQTTFDCADLGPNVVSLTVADISGNTHSADATITVEDMVAPDMQLLASGDTLRLDKDGMRLVTVPGIIGTVGDNCTDVDDITISVSYTNVCDNTTQIGSSVTLLCDDVSTLDCAQSISNPNGLRKFVITATDEEGNSTVLERDYYVIDLFAPDVYPKNVTLYLPQDLTGQAKVHVDAGLYTGVEGATSTDPVGLDSATTDACGIQTTFLLRSATQSTPDVSLIYDCNDLGANSYFLRATDVNDNRAAYQGVVTIMDTIKPTVVTDVATVYVNQDGDATLDPFDLILTGTDNIDECGLTYGSSDTNYDCSHLIFDPSIVAPNRQDAQNLANWTATVVTSYVTDFAGNVRERAASVKVVDTIAPVLIRQTIDVNLGVNDFVTLQNVQDTIISWVSSDNCLLDPSRGGLARTYFDCSDVGPNSVTLTMFDVYGNSNQVQLNVIVHDLVAPVALVQDITVELDGNGNATILASAVDNGSSDNCGIVSYSIDQNSFDCSNVGANDVVLTVTDEEGNTASATAVVTVEDNVLPLLTNVSTSVTISLGADGKAGLDSTFFRSQVIEACAFTSSFTTDTFDCSEVGINQVVYTAIDASGNSSVVSIDVTVEDNIWPIHLLVQNVDLYLDADGDAVLDFMTHVDNGSYDNCSYTASLSQVIFGCGDVNLATDVVVTLVDPSGNLSTSTIAVTARDTLGPVFSTSQNDTTLYAVQYDCFAIFATANGVPSFDAGDQNCPGPVTYFYQLEDQFGNTNTIAEGSPIPVGQWIVNTIASDLIGNESYASFSVTVVDTTLPTMQFLTAPIIALGSSGSTTLTPAMVENSSFDNCGIESVVITPATVDCDDLGSVSLTVVVTDWNSNVSTYPGIVATVVDEDSPTITVEPTPVAVSLDSDGLATIDSDDVIDNIVDNCTAEASILVSVSPTSFDCSDVGSVTLTITATDASGNTSVATKAINVLDELSPVITVNDITLALTANGSVGLPLNTASATDNCSSASVEYSNASFTCSDLGVNTVTVNSQDASGNVSTEQFTVTITDVTAPTAVAVVSPVIVELDNNGTASITTSDVVASTSDNCGPVVVTIAPSSFGCSDLGNNTVIITATDGEGNTSTVSKVVSVVDTESPTMTTVSGVVDVYLDATGQATITNASVVTGATDNCTVVPTVSLSQTSFDCSEVGSNTVTITAVDASGNSSTATKAVVVRDTLSPVITAPSALTLSIGSSGAVTLAGSTATATDNCGSPTVTYSETSFSCSDLGTNNVVVTATDANGNSSTETIVVTVQDVTNPILTLFSSAVDVMLDASGSGAVSTAQLVSSATDNCSAVSLSVSPSTFSCTDLGAISVTVTATDASGNTTTAAKSVTVKDMIAPTITTVSSAVDVYLDATGQATITNASVVTGATDNCTVVPTVSLSQTSFDCSEVGSNTVTITAVDASGNSSTATKAVVVRDTLSPVITAPSALTLSIGSSGAVTLAGSTATATDNCGSPTVTYSETSFSCSDLGTNNVVVTATDANGNSSTETIVVTVQDVTNPTLALTPGTITLGLDAAGNTTLTTAQVVSSVTDNCSGVTVVVSPSAFGCVNLGANTVTVTATDASGNTTTATKSVTVVDLVDPVITLVTNPSDVVLDANGSAAITTALVVASVTDNCTSTPTVVVTPTSVDCSDLGVVTVTVIATDASGNTTAITVPLNVVDNTAPIIVSAPSDTTLAECDAQFVYAVNVTDNCSFTSTMTSGLASGSMFSVGVTTVEWLFSDASGNTTVHSFDVTVLPLGTYTLPIKDEFCFDNGPFDLQNGQPGLIFSGPGVTASGDVFQPAQAGIGVHILDFIFTDDEGCVQIGTWTATVRPTPQQPTLVQLSPTTLSSSVAGATYKWYRNGGRLVGETNKDLSITQGGNYQVEVYNAYGCFRRSTGFVISSTGLNIEELLKTVSIYPNPTTSFVSISFSSALESEVQVRLIDLLGRTLYNGSIAKGELAHSIDMSGMSQGTYQLIVIDNESGNSTIEQIIKVD
mgnify:CR=1 FL=1